MQTGDKNVISYLIHIDTTIEDLRSSRNITTDNQYYEYLASHSRFSEEII